MKANRLGILLFVLLVSVVKVPAQEMETNHSSGWHPPASDQITRPAPSGNTTNVSAINASNAPTFDEIKAKAEKGDAEAQFELGTNLWWTDETKAMAWLLKAAAQNHRTACFFAGVYFSTSGSPDYNPSKAFEFYSRGARLGDAGCEFFAGQAYVFGDGTTTNIAEGIKWIGKAADQDYALAAYSLAEWYYKGTFGSKNLTNAIYWYEKAAAQTDDFTTHAQLQLGRIFAGAANYGEAIKWTRKAAEAGDVNAQFLLGALYENIGDTQERNDHGLNTVPKFNFPPANFGILLNSPQQDYQEAVKWYRKAAEADNTDAQYYLGECYYTGKGIPQSYAEAIKWYRKSAEQGNLDAQMRLTGMYSTGIGVPQDFAEAAKWCRMAADQGHTFAEGLLGAMYESGEGVPQDYVEAYKWDSLAAAKGLKMAATNRDDVASWMTPDQIAEAQQLSRKFVPRNKTIPNFTSPRPDEVISTETEPKATGTGFFITDDGYLISNYHVVKDATKVRWLTSAGLIDAKVVQVDAANDLALLKSDGRFASLPIAASRAVALGGTVATVGFPDIGLQGFAPKLAKGEIASLSGAADDPRYFQISVPCQPGNSGGALVDDRGNVIGIVSAKLDASAALAASGALPENVNYAVKSSFLLSFLESVPAVSAKLKAPNAADEKFEDVVKSAQQAAVLVLVY